MQVFIRYVQASLFLKSGSLTLASTMEELHGGFDSYDFRKWGNLFFQLLQTFCYLANSTVTNSVDQFRLNTFITHEIISPTQFQTQVDQILDLFQTSTSTLFARPLKLFRATDQGNAFSITSRNKLASSSWKTMLKMLLFSVFQWHIIMELAHVPRQVPAWNQPLSIILVEQKCILLTEFSQDVFVLNPFFYRHFPASSPTSVYRRFSTQCPLVFLVTIGR